MLNTALHTHHNKGVRVAPLSKKQIQIYANQLREIFESGLHQPFDVVRCLEIELPKAMGHKFVFELQDRKIMGMTEAAVLPDKKLMHIREDVYEALHNNDSRARFTIAHEFGHLLMHKGVALNRGDGNHKTYEDSEWQANRFAAELLAPLDGCVGLSIDEIMLKYNIGYQCASLRYKECKSR